MRQFSLLNVVSVVFLFLFLQAKYSLSKMMASQLARCLWSVRLSVTIFADPYVHPKRSSVMCQMFSDKQASDEQAAWPGVMLTGRQSG